MVHQVKYSVVVPAYNRGEFLHKLLDSVFKQTYQNFELIIVDDGSTDNTRDLIKSNQDARTKYIYQDNGGGSKARNTGIDAAQGYYIAFLDSDDAFMPNHLENALTVLESGDNLCTYTQVIVDRGDGVTFLKPPRALNPNEPISDYLMRDRGFIQTSTLIVPAELAKKVKFNEEISFGQDTDFAIRLASAGAEFRMLPEPGAIWNDEWNQNRLSSKRKHEQRILWLNKIKPMITKKAYWADMGWHVAKGFAQHGELFKALNLYLNAVVRGSYRLKMAIVVFLQVVLSANAYRKLADSLARFGVAP
ncbi:glycosyltransferase family 2 protein [Methylosarcina fibrata]|uniref:glycosyltransferase family 2 protein n=1 Tax=Methylosarcina fibrata TaxID=105972 RepID=UPI0003A044A2|nr:glycosyltransferase family 2 protein [Methylosarcina fibrata]